LIVMKFHELERNEGQQEYIPIRKVTIVKCEKVGDYFYLYMRLGDFILFGEGGLSQYREKFRRALDNSDRNILVMYANFHEKFHFISSKVERLEIENWLKLAKLLSSPFTPRMESYEHTVFLKFQSLTDGLNRQIHPIPLTKRLEISLLSKLEKYIPRARQLLISRLNALSNVDNWGYLLYVARMYTIKIIQFFHPYEEQTFFPEDAILELDVPKDIFFISQKYNQIIGHQDLHQFTLETSGNQATRTSFIIKPREGSSPKYRTALNGQHSLTIPDINLPVQVQHSIRSIIWFYVIPIMVFLFGSLMVTVSTSELITLPFLSRLISGEPTRRVIELTFGLFFQAIGLYILKKDRQ
jgi:hypothetical protein